MSNSAPGRAGRKTTASTTSARPSKTASVWRPPTPTRRWRPSSTRASSSSRTPGKTSCRRPSRSKTTATPEGRSAMPLPNPMPSVDQLLALQSRPGAAFPAGGHLTDTEARKVNPASGLLTALARTLAGQPVRAPLPAPAPAPTAPPVAPPVLAQPTQPATAKPHDKGLELAKANMMPIFRRLHELIGGQLTDGEVRMVNRVAWQIGRLATDEEIEAIAQRLANEFEPASAPLMPTESSY